MTSSDSGKIKRLDTDDIGKELDGCLVTAVKLIFERSGFVIFACKGGFTVKGNYAGAITEGITYKVSGMVTAYRDQPQISASVIEQAESDEDDTALIAGFLKDNLEDVGEKIAGRLAQTYGSEVIDALMNDPEEAAKQIDGLTADKAADISREFEKDTEYYRLLMELRKLGLSNKRAVKVYGQFGDGCITTIRDNPYILMRVTGIGFDTCELIAKRLHSEPLSITRFEGAIVSALSVLHEESGDTYLYPEQVRNKVLSILSKDTGEVIPEDVFDGLYRDGLARAKEDRFIIIYRFAEDKCAGCDITDEGARIALRTYFGTEYSIKKEIESFIGANRIVPDEDKMNKRIEAMGRKEGITLNELQTEAIKLCMYSPVAIITGGPGTGKTTITSILARHFRKEKIPCRFCAPTGRAAKRLSEASGETAFTIHRLLEMSAPSEDDDDDTETFFGRNRSNPLECRVVVADEASMIDIFLFKALLDALPPGASLILVGDPEQLPSVGAGNVLADLISCPVVPCVKLEYVFRQADDSSIASNAVRILRGEYPVPGEDFEIIKTGSDEEAMPYITKLSSDNADDDFVILSPTRRNLLGTEHLNGVLQEHLNSGEEEPVSIRADLRLYPGDNIMQIKNNYSIEYYDPSEGEIRKGVFNGEMGKYKGYDVLTGKYDFLFDGDRKIGYTKKTLSDIELAYAVTVHKAQGCEFDSVAVVLGSMNYKLSNKKLLYTAVTRGRNKVTLIDSADRLRKMLSSDADNSRKSSLKDFLTLVAARHTDESDKAGG